MKLLEIKQYPDKILRRNCRTINSVTQREKELLNRMAFAMRYFNGIGLAGPQVGVAEKLIVAEVEKKVIKLANPRVLKASGKETMSEGCLSLPGLSVDVVRPYSAVVEGMDENGKIIRIEADGLLARVLQHEIDHLKGKLIIDYLSWWRKLKFKIRRS